MTVSSSNPSDAKIQELEPSELILTVWNWMPNLSIGLRRCHE